MGLQKYRADEVYETDRNGTRMWVTRWMGGPSYSKLENCPTPFGRRTVYITGEADTWFSLPAACTFKGKTVRGYVTRTDEAWEFRAYVDCYWFPHVKQES